MLNRFPQVVAERGAMFFSTSEGQEGAVLSPKSSSNGSRLSDFVHTCSMTDGDQIRIEPWAPEDLPLLERTMGDAEMTVYLGGPEDAAKLAERQTKYERLASSGNTHWRRRSARAAWARSTAPGTRCCAAPRPSR